ARLLRRERILGDRRDLAVDLHRRRHARGDEQVRRLLVRHQLEETGEVDAAHVWLLRSRRFGIGDPGFGKSVSAPPPKPSTLTPLPAFTNPESRIPNPGCSFEQPLLLRIFLRL